MGFILRNLVDEDVLEWQFESYEILIRNLSSGPGLPDSELWLPINEHFGHADGKKLAGPKLGKFVFERISQQCLFSPDQMIDLNVVSTPKGGFMGGTAIVHIEGQTACGLYQIQENESGDYLESITIDEALCENPTNLIATLAHELSHALHNRMREPLDIEPELYELFTDLTAVYLGYGVFIANSRFEFTSIQDGGLSGWQASGAGYLPETDLIMALAIFMEIKGIEPEAAKQHLKPRLAKMLDKALKQLKNHHDKIKHLAGLTPAVPDTDNS